MCFSPLYLIAISGLCLQRYSTTNPCSPLLVSPLLKATCYFEKMRHPLSVSIRYGKQRKGKKKKKNRNTLYPLVLLLIIHSVSIYISLGTNMHSSTEQALF